MTFPVPCTHTGYAGCKDEAHVHWSRSGSCAVGDHNGCRGTGYTLGGRKTYNCPCPCHQQTPWRQARDLGQERTVMDVFLSPLSRTL